MGRKQVKTPPDSDVKIKIYRYPRGIITKGILEIVGELSKNWFTADVAPNARRDLRFQCALCALEGDIVRSFIIFTSLDGAIQITLMGTSLMYRGRGLGSKLINRLESYAKRLGYDELVAFTVPPAVKPAYLPTVQFYLKHGFTLVKEYTELWQSGALELRKRIT